MKDETNFLTDTQYIPFMSAIPKMRMFHKPVPRTTFSPRITQLLFAVIHDGAFRVSEVLKLTPSDLIIDKKLIKLEGTKGTKKSKGNQKREFGWVKPNLWEELLTYSLNFAPDERMFKTSRQTVRS
jgi:integrase